MAGSGSSPKKSYSEMSEELESILSILQQGDLDVEDAINQYERGIELTHELEKYLETAENKITKLKAKFGNGSSANSA